MIAPDTNLLVYAHDARDPAKQSAAIAVISALPAGRTRLGLQCVGEFVTACRRKLKMSADRANSLAGMLCDGFSTFGYGVQDVRQALLLSSTGRFSYWDAVLVSSTLSAGCNLLISEDLQSGSIYGDLRIISPFSELGAVNPDLMEILKP